jgi:aminomethyltransferase
MSDAADLKRTPLHAEHVRLGGKMIGFGGWDMPVQYTGIMDEHHAVRKALGVFDISHMGQFFARSDGSAGAAAWLNSMLTNNVNKLAPGQGQYTLMLNERGGVIDDLIIYRIADAEWLLVVNAAKITEDFEWLNPRAPAGVTLENRSEEFFGLAVQGPRAAEWFAKFSDGKTAPARNGVVQIEAAGSQLFICRTGYTGEDGFEVFGPAADAVSVLGAVLAAGAEFGIKPCGLGARDTLRMEMCYPLNGNDLSPERTPIEAGLGFFVDLEKGDFTGRSVLAEQKAGGAKQRLAAFKMIGATPPPRSHYAVWKDGAQIGETCSGGLSPSLGCGIGLAYLPAEFAKPGTAIEIDVRGRRFPAQVEKKPLWRKPVES